MIQLQEVTATLCIFKSPQWSHLCCWLLAFESFLLWWKHVVMEAWLVLKCTSKWHGLLPVPNIQLCPFQRSSLLPSCMGTVFLMSKIYFKMPFLKLWRWNQDTSPGPRHRWTTRVVIWVWPAGSNLYYAVSVNELSSSILKHGIHTVKSVCVSSCVGLRQHIFSCPEKMKSSRAAIRCKMWSFRRLCPSQPIHCRAVVLPERRNN